MHPVQTTGVDALVNRLPREPKTFELLKRHNPMLLRRDLRNRAIPAQPISPLMG